MMTWKKVVAAVLAGTLAFALAGCGPAKHCFGEQDHISEHKTMNQIGG